MNNLKCQNCGADITSDEAQNSGKCPYCNSRFASEKKVQPKLEDIASTPTINSVRPHKIPRRPRIRFLILIMLFFLGGPLFIGYIIYVEIQKKIWDSKYLNTNNSQTDMFDN